MSAVVERQMRRQKDRSGEALGWSVFSNADFHLFPSCRIESWGGKTTAQSGQTWKKNKPKNDSRPPRAVLYCTKSIVCTPWRMKQGLKWMVGFFTVVFRTWCHILRRQVLKTTVAFRRISLISATSDIFVRCCKDSNRVYIRIVDHKTARHRRKGFLLCKDSWFVF